MSLRARLSLLVVGGVALGLIVVTATTYVVLSRRIHAETDRALSDRADAVVAQTRAVPFRDVVVAPRLDTLVDATTFVQIVDLEGHVAARTANLPADVSLPVDQTTLAAAKESAGRFRMVTVSGIDLRLVETPLSVAVTDRSGSRSTVVGVVQVARPVSDIQADLRKLLVILVIGDRVAPVLAGGLALWLAPASLRPPAAMQSSAGEGAATRGPARGLRPGGP